MTATTFLRPVHAWFGFWDGVAGPVARVVAVLAGAAVTAALLVGLGAHPVEAAGVALAVWIGLAIAQEHDERVRLAADPVFTEALAAAVAEPPLRLVVQVAHGPSRAHRDEPEVFVLGPLDSDEAHPFAGWYVEVVRDRSGRPMHLSAHPERGTGDHDDWIAWDADDLEEVATPLADARAIATALRARLP